MWVKRKWWKQQERKVFSQIFLLHLFVSSLLQFRGFKRRIFQQNSSLPLRMLFHCLTRSQSSVLSRWMWFQVVRTRKLQNRRETWNKEENSRRSFVSVSNWRHCNSLTFEASEVTFSGNNSSLGNLLFSLSLSLSIAFWVSSSLGKENKRGENTTQIYHLSPQCLKLSTLTSPEFGT